MAIGRYVTDLDKGDVLGPLDYTISKFVVREYCHANELHQDCFQNDVRVAPPTLVHLDKLRLYKHACPAGTGPTARVHYEYHAKHHSPAYVGERVIVTGHIVDKYVKRGRPYLWYYLEVRTADGRLVTTSNDLTLLKYKVES